MKITSLILATAILTAPAVAFAQSSPSPNNQSGPGVSATTPAPTDPGAGNETGNSKAMPERGTMNKSGSMGSGKMGSSAKGESKGTTTGSGSTPQDRDPAGTRAPYNAK